jgi:hypothetical protein
MLNCETKKLTDKEEEKIEGKKDFVKKVACPICGSTAYKFVLYMESFVRGYFSRTGYSAEIKAYTVCHLENVVEHLELKNIPLKRNKLLCEAEKMAELFCNKEEFNERKKAHLKREKATCKKIKNELLAKPVGKKIRFTLAKKILLKELEKLSVHECMMTTDRKSEILIDEIIEKVRYLYLK